MKSIVAVCLVVVFAFNFGGAYLLLKIEQHQIRKEVKQKIKKGIKKDELTLITVTSQNINEIEWEHDDEFRYKGKMYDVVYKETHQNTVIYYTLPDKKEHQLIENYLKKINKNHKKNQRQSTLKLFKIVYKVPTVYGFNQDFIALERYPKQTFNYLNLYHSITIEVSSPPPKQV